MIATARLENAQMRQNTMTQEAALMNGLLRKITCRIMWNQLCPVLVRLLEPVLDVLKSDDLSNMTEGAPRAVGAALRGARAPA